MKDFTAYLNETEEIGYVEQVADAIIYVSGLPKVKVDEIVVFETGEFGHVFSINPDFVEVLIFSKQHIQPGTRVARTNEVLRIPVGSGLLGRVINPLCQAIDDGKPIQGLSERRPIHPPAPGIIERKSITKQFETGVLLVDLAIPLGHGQRELILGERKTGKTNFLTRTILTQTKKGNICVYAGIGKKKMDIKKVAEFFKKEGVLDKMVIAATGSSDSTGLIYLTPYMAMTIAEYFRDQGKDVLLVLDDMTSHAKFYREIALLGRRFPGRNSYPSDIFYAHAKLMERGGNFKTDKGEASITCLPVAETSQGDLSGYIETNLMSMTDGHLYFDRDLFYLGRRPAIHPFLSVTRVGRQTQDVLRRELSREIMSFLNLYEKMQSFVHFGAEINENIKATLSMGDKIIAFFTQITPHVMPLKLEMALFAMFWANLWDGKDANSIKDEMYKTAEAYNSDEKIKKKIDSLSETDSFNKMLGIIKQEGPGLLKEVLVRSGN